MVGISGILLVKKIEFSNFYTVESQFLEHPREAIGLRNQDLNRLAEHAGNQIFEDPGLHFKFPGGACPRTPVHCMFTLISKTYDFDVENI